MSSHEGQPAHRLTTASAAFVVFAIALLGGGCVTRVPEPVSRIPGTPYVSWVFMSGDRDNPDHDYACQSDPRDECVIPASRSNNQVFSDVHFYYHGSGPETKYTGTIQIGFFGESPQGHKVAVDIDVQKGKSIANASVTGIVTSKPGMYSVTFDLTATPKNTGRTQPIREEVRVVVK